MHDKFIDLSQTKLAEMDRYISSTEGEERRNWESRRAGYVEAMNVLQEIIEMTMRPNEHGIKPCPGCGASFEKLSVTDGETYRWRTVTCGACGEWSIEARVTTCLDESGIYQECVQSWNESDRSY